MAMAPDDIVNGTYPNATVYVSLDPSYQSGCTPWWVPHAAFTGCQMSALPAGGAVADVCTPPMVRQVPETYRACAVFVGQVPRQSLIIYAL